MRIYFLTVFPEIIETYIKESVLGRALEAGLFEAEVINIRDYSTDKHRRTDDYPYGGGAGMLMTVQPIADAIKSIPNWSECEVIYPSPAGETFKQRAAKELYDSDKDLIFICGHYEGVDQRLIDKYVTKEFSLGDFVLTGGELPSLAMADAVLRHVPGLLGNSTSLEEESFSERGLLEYPQYTRPAEYEGMKVPEILLSGHHKKIEEWKLAESIKRTKELRPDLFKLYQEANGNKDD